MSPPPPPETPQRPSVEVYTHLLPASPSLLHFLSQQHLPQCIPLLRRLQHPDGFNVSAVLLTTFSPGVLEGREGDGVEVGGDMEGGGDGGEGWPDVFAVGVFDRATAPGIQGWVFSSVERDGGGIRGEDQDRGQHLSDDGTEGDRNANASEKSTHEEQRRRRMGDGNKRAEFAAGQLLALFTRFAEISPPTPSLASTSTTATNIDANNVSSSRVPGAGAADLDLLMIGSAHERVRQLLAAHPSRPLREDLFGAGGPFTKYLIPLGRLRSGDVRAEGQAAVTEDGTNDVGGYEATDLSADMRYTPVYPSDYAEVMRHNQYIRHPSNLDGMRGCGIRIRNTTPDAEEESGSEGSEDRLIAFAFLGHDGSVRTVRVADAFRGQGLGMKLARHLLLTQYHVFVGLGDGGSSDAVPLEGSHATVLPAETGDSVWMSRDADVAHTDIAPGNAASVRVFAKLGAVPMWRAYWVRVDLGRARRWVELGEVGS